MRHFGQTLRKGRERRGLSLEHVSQATRIRVDYLQALESRDLGHLPGSTFNKGFVKAYAQCVGLDPQALVEAYTLEERAQCEAGKIAAPADVIEDLQGKLMNPSSQKSTDRKRYFVPALVTALALGGVALLGMRLSATASAPTPAAQAEAVAAAREMPARIDPVPVSAASPAVTPPPPHLAQEPVAEVFGDATVANAEPGSAPAVEPVVVTDATAAAETALGATTLQIADQGVGTRVVDKHLEGRGNTFPAGTWVYFWADVRGGKSGDFVKHAWLHDGRPVQVMALPVSGPQWSTHSRRLLSETMVGPWAVEVRDASGLVLSRSEFNCTAPSAVR